MRKQATINNFVKRGGTVEPPPTKVAAEKLKRPSSSDDIDQTPGVRKVSRQLPSSLTNLTSNLSRNASQSGGGSAMRKSMKENHDQEREQLDFSKLYKLSTSQKKVLDAIMSRRSVFFTGAAGTGKSYVVQILRTVIEILEWEDKIAYTAPTGVAACNIRGLTIHSWAGVGKASEPIEQLLPMVLRNSNACKRWRETEILVIDEISMLSAELFDKLDIIGRRVRNNINPFGGLQVIVCGDFFQLPPVGLGKTVKFCFEASAWKDLFEYGRDDGMIILDKVFRQKDDTTFLNLLNEMREGTISPRNQQVLQQKVQEAQQLLQQEQQMATTHQGFFQTASSMTQNANSKSHKLRVRPTKLFSTNQDVDQYNMNELERLQKNSDEDDADKDPVIFFAVDQGKDPYLTQIKSGTKAPEKLYLKKGAQVMLLKNLDTERGLVNGARGTVVDFERSNGRTSFSSVLPVVNFAVVIGSERSEERVTLIPDTWEVKLGDSVLASRQQIPLMLAWAISIHKSQGMTIPLLEVSFNRMFEFGQAYVALSRATSLQGLTLHSFQVNAIRAHPLVKEFYRQIAVRQQQQQQHHCHTADDILEVSLREFVDAFGKDYDSKQIDHDEWMETRPRSTATAEISSSSLSSASSMPHTSSNSSSIAATQNRYSTQEPMNSSIHTSATTARKPSALFNSTLQSTAAAAVATSAVASTSFAPTFVPVGSSASSAASTSAAAASSSTTSRQFQQRTTQPASHHGFQDATSSNTFGDDWLDQDFLSKKRAENAKRIAEYEQLAQSLSQQDQFPRFQSAQPKDLQIAPSAIVVSQTTASSSAPSSSSKNKMSSPEDDAIIYLLDSSDEESEDVKVGGLKIPAVANTPANAAFSQPKVAVAAGVKNDYGGYGSRPHFDENNRPLDRILTGSSSAASPLKRTSTSTSTANNTVAGAAHTTSIATMPPAAAAVTNNSMVMNESLKRKLEENRQKALEKLAMFKKSRIQEPTAAINPHSI